MSRKKYHKVIDWLIKWIIGLIGLLLAVAFTVWSITEQNLPRLGAPPTKITMLLILVNGLTIYICALLYQIRLLNTEFGNVLEEVQSHALSQARVRTTKNSSIEQVALMLEEAGKKMADGVQEVRIFEAHLEPDAPKKNKVLKPHLSLVKKAAKESLHLDWRIIVGQSGVQKNGWLQNLKGEMEEKSNNRYQVYEMKAPPFLNIITIPEIKQTYFGMVDWHNLKPGSTGGVWIESEHVSNVLTGIFTCLLDDINFCKKV